MNRGDIVLVTFPFTDFTTTKVRPAVIISNDDINETRGDPIVAFISFKTQRPAKNTDFIVEDTDPGFLNTGLKQQSLFSMVKITTIDRSLISVKIGKVTEEIRTEIDKRLCKALALHKKMGTVPDQEKLTP